MSKDNRLAARELPRLGGLVRKARNKSRIACEGQVVESMYSDKTDEAVGRTVAQSSRPNESERVKKGETVVNSSFQWR